MTTSAVPSHLVSYRRKLDPLALSLFLVCVVAAGLGYAAHTQFGQSPLLMVPGLIVAGSLIRDIFPVLAYPVDSTDDEN